MDVFWQVWSRLAPWLLIGAAISGLLHVWLPANYMARRLSGRWGVVRAVLLGVPLPLCSCGVIPTGLGLRKDGASKGATVGFLVSTPQTGIDSILVSGGMLGMPFALFKVFSAAFLGVVAGVLADAVHDRERETAEKDGSSTVRGCGRDEVACDARQATERGAERRSWREGLDHAEELLAAIWKWVVFGVAFSALITVFVPSGMASWLQHVPRAWLYVGVLAVSVPLYVCATSSVPIAAALVAGGFPPGAALVFLMAGPATNVATIGAVYGALGKRTTAVYLGTIIVGSTLLAMVFDHMIPTGGPPAAVIHAHELSWWSQGAGWVLAGLFMYFLFKEFRGFFMKNKLVKLGLTVKVAGMTCHGCSSRLQKVLEREPGVAAAEVSLERQQAVIQGQMTLERAKELIEGAGFEVVD